MESVASILVSLMMTIGIISGASGMAEVTPEEATTEFLDGIRDGNKQVVESYMDNEYVNFLYNIEGSEKDINKIQEAIVKGFKYEILEVIQKDNIAVAKVQVANKDFSKVMKGYEKTSYNYVMENLYDERIVNKKYLSAECTRLYAEQIEKAAKADNSREKEIYIPMKDDGYYGWQIIADDKIMKAITGGLELPVKR